jgi:cation/acetate symporter
MISKMLLLVVAVAAALVAAQKPADILFLVSAAFSLAAAAFFPALVLRHLLEAHQPGSRIARHGWRVSGITFYYMA